MSQARPRDETLVVSVALPASASWLLGPDTGTGTPLDAVLAADLEALLSGLGIPGPVRVVATGADGDPDSSDAVIGVNVGGRRLRYPDELLIHAYAYATNGLPDTEMTPLHIREWMGAPAEPGGDPDRRDAIIEFCRLAVRAVASREPEAWVTAEQARALADALAEEIGRPASVDADRLHATLSAVLSLGISIANRSVVASALAGDAGRSVAQLREDVIDALRTDAIQIRMPQDLLRQMTQRWQDDGPKVFPFLRDGLAVELGLTFPKLEFVADPDLRPSSFAFKLNDIVSMPMRALETDRLLVNDTPERVRNLDPRAAAALNPATAQPASTIGADLKAAAEERGLTTWGQLDHLVLCLAEFLRQHGWQTIHRAGVTNQLRSVRAAFPALVSSIQSRMPVEHITAALRSLLRQRVSVRNLRALLEGWLDDASRRMGAGDALQPSEDELVVIGRVALGHEITNKASRSTNTLVVYLLDASIERLVVDEALVAADAGRRILRGLRAEMRHLPPTAQLPHLLTVHEARAALQRLVTSEYPRMAVLSHDELPPGINVMPVARIQMES